MILSWYERKDSPVVWIQYGEDYEDRQYLRTLIRKDDPAKKNKVKAELHRLEAQLIRPGVAANVSGGVNRGGWGWVTGYLATRYANRVRTRQVYLAQWRSLLCFLDECEIDGPVELTRDVVFEYPAWRTTQVKEKSRRNPKINTALGELKLLGLVMDEANRRHLAFENPARKLGIEPELGELPPELSDEQIGVIRRELRKEGKNRDWMEKSFEMALRTGMRRDCETRVHRSQVRLASNDIVIEKPKGGRRREFAIPIYRSIRGLIKEFMASGREYLWTAPAGTLTGLAWSRFMERTGLRQKGIMFRCTRITFITRGCRGGIPEAVMMKMVNHGRKDISRIYQRWTAEDVRRYAERAATLCGYAGRAQNRHRKVCRRAKGATVSSSAGSRYKGTRSRRRARRE